MFIKPCEDKTPHETHTHVHHWEKRSEEPEGWFPPGTYMERTPDEGHDAVYRCRGIEQSGPSQDSDSSSI